MLSVVIVPACQNARFIARERTRLGSLATGVSFFFNSASPPRRNGLGGGFSLFFFAAASFFPNSSISSSRSIAVGFPTLQCMTSRIACPRLFIREKNVILRRITSRTSSPVRCSTGRYSGEIATGFGLVVRFSFSFLTSLVPITLAASEPFHAKRRRGGSRKASVEVERRRPRRVGTETVARSERRDGKSPSSRNSLHRANAVVRGPARE
eukprot:10108-Pelagococcus_subviridis.AAC.4